jgi:hypothetical protein
MKVPAGQVTATAAVRRGLVSLRPSSLLAAAGDLLSVFYTRLYGPAGTVTLTAAPVADAELIVYLRHQVRLDATVTADAVLTVRG